MNSGKVSIIVPIYKVEQELDRCIQSILKQSYANLEIILIDDGSPDKCPKMCDTYAQQDSRIKVLHKENGGLSDARNAGLDIATGEFFAFIDSDDWVADNFIECLVGSIIETDPDIAVCGFALVNNLGQMRHYVADKEREILEHDQALSALFVQQKFECTICTKMYRRILFKNIRFPKGRLYEDIAVSLPLFDKSRRCVIINNELYYYFQRSGSIVNSKFSKKRLDMLEYVQKMIDYSHAHNHKYDLEAESFYLKAIMTNVLHAYKDTDAEDAPKCIVFLKNELRKHKKYIWGNKYIEKRRQIVMYMILLDFPSTILVKIWEARMKAKYE